jgi:hypothetical protein
MSPEPTQVARDRLNNIKSENEKLYQLIKSDIEKQHPDAEARCLKRLGLNEEKSKDADELWAAVEKKGDELIQEGMRGYDNYVSSMSQICVACLLLAKAISASDPIGSAIGKGYTAVRNTRDMDSTKSSIEKQLKEIHSLSTPTDNVEELESRRDRLREIAKDRGLDFFPPSPSPSPSA